MVDAVETSVSFSPQSWGEQAGLFWRGDDRNYAKLVIEQSRDGSTAVVFALELDGCPAVVAKQTIAPTTKGNLLLRFELSPDLTMTALAVHEGELVAGVGLGLLDA
jgi:hypothetical protein